MRPVDKCCTFTKPGGNALAQHKGIGALYLADGEIGGHPEPPTIMI